MANLSGAYMFDAARGLYRYQTMVSPPIAFAEQYDVCKVRSFYTQRLRDTVSSVSQLKSVIMAAIQAAAYMYEESFGNLVIQSIDDEIYPSEVIPSTNYNTPAYLRVTSTLAAFAEERTAASHTGNVCAELLFDIPDYSPIVGAAYTGAGCTASHYFGMVCVTSAAETSVIAAHETGHLMSAGHTLFKYIMNEDISLPDLIFLFHQQSKDAMNAWAQQAVCLVQENSTSTIQPQPYDSDDNSWWQDYYTGILVSVIFAVGLTVVVAEL